MTDPLYIPDGADSGLVPYGPDHPDYPNAPSDWDGGPYLCRDGGMYYMRGYGWGHGLFCSNPTSDWDRVAYRARDPLTLSPVTETPHEISDEFINLLNQEEPWTPEQYAAVESGGIA